MGNMEMYFQFRTHESLVSDFSSRIGFGFLGENSSVLQITLVSETPDRDIDFIDKLIETSLADNLDRKNDAANKTIRFINDQLSRVSKSLNESQGEMTNFRQANKMVSVDEHTGEIMGKATKYDTEQATLRLRETYLNYLAKYLKTNMEDGEVIAPGSFGITDPMLMNVVQLINDKINERISNDYQKDNPYYSKNLKEIERAKITAANA